MYFFNFGDFKEKRDGSDCIVWPLWTAFNKKKTVQKINQNVKTRLRKNSKTKLTDFRKQSETIEWNAVVVETDVNTAYKSF